MGTLDVVVGTGLMTGRQFFGLISLMIGIGVIIGFAWSIGLISIGGIWTW